MSDQVVYLVLAGYDYDGDNVVGVYASQEEAERAARGLLTEWPAPDRVGVSLWKVGESRGMLDDRNRVLFLRKDEQ